MENHLQENIMVKKEVAIITTKEKILLIPPQKNHFLPVAIPNISTTKVDQMKVSLIIQEVTQMDQAVRNQTVTQTQNQKKMFQGQDQDQDILHHLTQILLKRRIILRERKQQLNHNKNKIMMAYLEIFWLNC